MEGEVVGAHLLTDIAVVSISVVDLPVALLGYGIGAGGAIVREILTGSAADKAELRVGDCIVAIDGATILGPGQLFVVVVSHRPGAAAEVEIVRDGRLVTIGVTLEGITP